MCMLCLLSGSLAFLISVFPIDSASVFDLHAKMSVCIEQCWAIQPGKKPPKIQKIQTIKAVVVFLSFDKVYLLFFYPTFVLLYTC